ncbi:MAG TPA: hypothetical protein VLM90_14125 [Candidatus Deferrimicrobium sp.]|nr:hypothetical protein [Candidatus Deferrimicrobium sp.]
MAENIPQPRMGFVKTILPVDFENIARPGHGHGDYVANSPGPVGHDYHTVGQRHGFDQIMGYEDFRS